MGVIMYQDKMYSCGIGYSYGGRNAPSSSVGNNGDYYYQWDSSGKVQTTYVKISGAWHEISGEGGSGSGVEIVTEAEYQELTTEEKNNGTVYMVEGHTLSEEKQIIERSTVATDKLQVSAYYNSGFEGYRCINGSQSDGWLPTNSASNWLIYNFGVPQKITKVKMDLINRNSSTIHQSMLYFEGSNDGGTTWTEIHSESFTASTTQNQLYTRTFDMSDDDDFYTMLRIRGAVMEWAWWLMELYAYTDYESGYFYYMSDKYTLTP